VPTYLYFCNQCAKRQDAFRRIAERDDCPACACGAATERRITATMVSVFSPYRSVAADKESGERPIIRSQAEHNAFLARNGYEEVGNDKSMAPKHPEEIAARRAVALNEQSADAFDFNHDTHEAVA